MPIKALVIGVSDYSAIGGNNLPFCANDITVFKSSLISGLQAAEENIFTLGVNGIVTKEIFMKKLIYMQEVVQESDTFIFYFSGHGGNIANQHHLIFSDTAFSTQEIIEFFDSLPAKNKLIIFDSCLSGNFEVYRTSSMESNMNINDFFGSGYAVISSSNATQSSWGHPAKPISLFTSFLCEAITSRQLIRKGEKSLSDIQKLLFLYLDIWNKHNPDKMQQPNFRANMGGTIIFPVEPYTPYQTSTYNDETEDYIIYTVEPLHSGIAKRYAVKVILKVPLTFDEISTLNHQIIEKVKRLEIYKTQQQEIRWHNKSANIVFCYFGRDEFDITNANYLCHTTWVDETQDKTHWYKISKASEVINDIHFNYHTYYNSLRIFQEENTGEVQSLISQTREITNNLISLSEKVISIFNELVNQTKTETVFIRELNELVPLINKWYFAESELPIPPQNLKSWCQACTGVASTIHDFTLFYGEHGLINRTPENRLACMTNTKDRYYEDLEKLQIEEQRISHLLNTL